MHSQLHYRLCILAARINNINNKIPTAPDPNHHSTCPYSTAAPASHHTPITACYDPYITPMLAALVLSWCASPHPCRSSHLARQQQGWAPPLTQAVPATAGTDSHRLRTHRPSITRPKLLSCRACAACA